MKREYSDLPSSQKIVYIKRTITVATISIIPLLLIIGIGTGLLFGIVDSYKTKSMPDEKDLNSTATKIRNQQGFLIDLKVFLLMFLLLAIVIGLSSLCADIGVWACNKLGLYTDINLEDAERKVAEIKKVLDLQREKTK